MFVQEKSRQKKSALLRLAKFLAIPHFPFHCHSLCVLRASQLIEFFPAKSQRRKVDSLYVLFRVAESYLNALQIIRGGVMEWNLSVFEVEK